MNTDKFFKQNKILTGLIIMVVLFSGTYLTYRTDSQSRVEIDSEKNTNELDSAEVLEESPMIKTEAENETETETEVETVPIPASGYVTVSSGDTLWGLALKYLGDGNKWKDLYYVNKEYFKEEAQKRGTEITLTDEGYPTSIQLFSGQKIKIEAVRVRLVSPSGGEIWYRGTTQDITWTQEDVADAVKAHLFCYEENTSGEQVYIGAIAYHLKTDEADADSPNLYSWDIPTDKSLSCPKTGKNFIIEVQIEDSNKNRIATYRGNPITVLPQQ